MTNQTSDCIFCKVVSGAIPSPRLFEDEDFICIKDIRPQAKAHLLVVPKKHIATLEAAFSDGAAAEQNEVLMGKMIKVATHVAKEQKLLPGGFRAVINTNENGGQTVFHIHLHLLGGEVLRGEFA